MGYDRPAPQTMGPTKPDSIRIDRPDAPVTMGPTPVDDDYHYYILDNDDY